MILPRAALAAALLVLLAACSTDRPKPTPLEQYEPRIAGRQVWNARFGNVGPLIVPAAREGLFFVATADGDVLALQADNGAVRWRARIGAPVAAGVGSDGRFVSVVTRGNEVVTLDSGREVWRKRVPSAVVTPPLVAGERVFVMGVDRAVHAFDALDGRRLWTMQRPGEALTLAQPGLLAAFRDTLLVGQGARLVALDPLRGTVQWDLPMASPRGTNEVERLADLVGPPARVGDRVCARAFQSAVACVDAARAAVLWSRSTGGANAVGGDDERVYGADASDRLTAWSASSGDVVWNHEKFLYRSLSGGLAVGPAVVFGDSEGFVHFLASATGAQQLRLPTDGSAVLGTPVLSGATLLVVTKNGGLYAFRPN
ncbi:Outer membrane protein assembly factor BamB [Rubrivivax sp. A210]|uniref:outer membrane protein assembly factor BamB n=1 Tax=Rubrivivax sp. A210 TaxID=2772301 RepID=UPI0019C0A78D|nr:outer membrane protein assembly factor BamB [Rubrivivax sp. A210]CAD5367328.1 Outer membrane protein assembly factor BamB [Rubrivivax sp. A210]